MKSFSLTKSFRVSTLLLVLASSFVSGCTVVKPWQRGTLAKPEMSLSGHALESEIQQHIFASKEASSGGEATAGGGCGCN